MSGGGGGGGGRGARTMLPSQELLDDLCSRFVLNAPDEELQSFERILFLVEQAHWFYEDNTMEQNASLKSLTLRDFTSLMFQSCSALRPYIANIDDIYKDFTTYKIRIPVTGAIILDESFERSLLVKGWKPGASWSFPRGKKTKDEEDHNCAIREVWEETGFDVSGLIQMEEYLEVIIGPQRMRLYIIPGVKEDTEFVPQTKKEISEIAWHRVDELPVASNETQSHNRGPTGMKYFMVWPFVGQLKRWIYNHRTTASFPKIEVPAKGTTVWKVKPNGSASATIRTGASSSPSPLVATIATTTATTASLIDAPYIAPPPSPGYSLRNFRFDRAAVLQKLEV